jgi:hypothetical protein
MSTHQFETAIEDPNHKLLNTNRTFMLKIPTTFSHRDFFSEYSYIKRKNNKFILIEKKIENNKSSTQIYKQ